MKNLDKKKEIAAKVLKTGVNKVRFKEDSLGEIKEALTREDIKELIKKKSIVKKNYSNRYYSPIPKKTD